MAILPREPRTIYTDGKWTTVARGGLPTTTRSPVTTKTFGDHVLTVNPSNTFDWVAKELEYEKKTKAAADAKPTAMEPRDEITTPVTIVHPKTIPFHMPTDMPTLSSIHHPILPRGGKPKETTTVVVDVVDLGPIKSEPATSTTQTHEKRQIGMTTPTTFATTTRRRAGVTTPTTLTRHHQQETTITTTIMETTTKTIMPIEVAPVSTQ